MHATQQGFKQIYAALLTALTLIVGCMLWEGYEIGRNQLNIRLLQRQMESLNAAILEQQRQGKQLDRIVKILETRRDRR